MPPVKKFRHSLKVMLSDCEVAALNYLHQLTGESMADHVRQAIMVYVRHHPDFDAGMFKLAADGQVGEKLSDPDLKAFFDQQLERYTQGLTKPIDGESTGIPRVPRLSSDVSHFDED